MYPTIAATAPLEAPDKGRRFTVLLVDDHISIRQMLAFVIPREGPFDIVAQASSGREALARWEEYKPDLVVLDLLLPEMNGIEVVRRLRRAAKGVRMLIYSGTKSDELIAEAMQEQPDGFVHKEDPLDALREALRIVAAGSVYYSTLAKESARKATNKKLAKLTTREREIVKLVAEGFSNKELAARLGVSIKTIEGHRSSIGEKLDIHDVATLTRFAVRNGLVSLE